MFFVMIFKESAHLLWLYFLTGNLHKIMMFSGKRVMWSTSWKKNAKCVYVLEDCVWMLNVWQVHRKLSTSTSCKGLILDNLCKGNICFSLVDLFYSDFYLQTFFFVIQTVFKQLMIGKSINSCSFSTSSFSTWKCCVY